MDTNEQQKPEGYTYITTGRVLDTIAAPRWYNVRTAAEPSLPCCDSANSGTLGAKTGPTRIGAYPPGVRVVVLVRTAKVLQADGSMHAMLMPPGIILGSVPSIVSSNAGRVIDWVTPFTGADAMNNAVHARPLSAWPTAYRDYNWDRPMDAVPGSDEGLINELGVGYGISRFFAWLRASDMAGLWCFYLDNLVRISAYNYEFWHSGGERTIKNDEGEINDIDLFTPYPWEAMGMLRPNTTEGVGYDEPTDGGIYKPGQNKLWMEPKFDDQVGIARHIVIRGYLGDMKREMVTLPKFSVDKETYVNRRMYTDNHDIGVLDIHQHSDGRYTVRSARGITHEKYLFIPVPNRVQEPEQSDKLGDGLSNYKPAGFYGEPVDAEATEIHGKENWVWSDDSRPDTWAAELYDAHAYLFNWYGIKPSVAHKKDFVVPEEGPNGDASGFVPADVLESSQDSSNEYDTPPRAAYLPDARLSDTFMFPLPSFADVQVDHRTGSSRYYFTRSLISQLPDGSVLIEDGYGSSMHMTGGNIFTSCAGDTWTRTGRSIINWAGDDYVARAGSSVDVSASNGDLRLKAEKNLHILGGNSGVDGGIIIENRAVLGVGGEFAFRNGDGDPLVGEDVKTFGIIIKTAESPLMVYGKNIYTRAVKDLAGGGGGIVTEAEAGITVSAAQDITRLTATGLTDVIGQTLAAGGTISSESVVNRFDLDNVIFGADGVFRSAAKNVLLDTEGGGIYANGPLAIANGVQAYPASTIQSLIANYSADYNSWLTGSNDTDLPVVLTADFVMVYSNGIMADTDFIDQAGFTCRNADQYGLGDDFRIVEARWQQMYRARGLGIVWYEPQVLVPGAGGDATRPHPGNSNWLYAESFIEYDPEIWDWDNGAPIARAGSEDADGNTVYPYDEVRKAREDSEETPEALKHRIMADNYVVSKQILGLSGSSEPE